VKAFAAEVGGYPVVVLPVRPDPRQETRWVAVMRDGGGDVAAIKVWDGATQEQILLELEAAYEAARCGIF
jgi:hypothetical protein